MGQTQTRSYDEVLTSEKIKKLRSELLELQEAGRAQRQRFNDELYEVESELYAVRMKLLKRGEESKSLWNFWDYAKEVNQTIHTKPAKRGTPSPAVTTPPSESRALVSPWYFFNIHSLFEAMLLRRLHIAMILQGQRDAQSSSWNGVIVHMYNVIPGIRENKKKTQEDFTITKEEIRKNIIHARESYENQLKLQKELVHFMVEEAKKGLVNNKQPIDRRSMRSMNSASTAPTLPGMIAHQEKKSPGGTSPTEDDSDASSLTSSDTSSGDDSSSSSSLGPDLR